MPHCNVTLFGEVDMENHDMCGFVNYHMFMLLLFGCMAVFCVSRAWLEYVICRASQDKIEKCLLWTALCLIFATGFDGMYILFAMCFICVCLQKPAQACGEGLSNFTRHMAGSIVSSATWICGGGFCALLRQTTPRKSVQVAPIVQLTLEDVVVPIHPHTMEISTLRECPICMDSNGNTDDWFIPVCGHAFHSECIKGWMGHGTCPLCRAPLVLQ
jgi:hypothetical protein